MRAQQLIGDRFEIDRSVGSGGMGEVFQARDRATGDRVAVKLLLEGHAANRSRFEREGLALAELRHPGIVEYVAHGVTSAGQAYLAMEWLDGEDLSARLLRGRLPVNEAVTLGARVAAALGAAHARGVIHRDLKPGNLRLVDRSVDRAKVLDFGIAYLAGAMGLTQTGVLIGTPGYMAPEQARGDPDLTPLVDVFALGCVLFECLTGEPAFTGTHVMAVLGKILFEDLPRIADIRPEVPAALSTLVGRMLEKDPKNRPRDAAAVASVLAAMEAGIATGPIGAPTTGPAPRSMTGERRLISVALVGASPPNACAPDAKLLDTQQMPAREALRAAALAHGGQLYPLADGSILVTILGTGIATDQAACAARCALALQKLSEGRPIAISTGRMDPTGKLSPGDALDRAASILGHAGSGTSIAIDDVTAGLLDARFDVVDTEAGPVLQGERGSREITASRTLLGRPTACVGRDRELALLEALFGECVEEPSARAALVTAAAGMGKSRLAHEFLHRIRKRSEPFAIWIGRGDAMRAGSAFALLGQAVRGAAGILESEPLEARQDKLRARVARHVAPEDRARVFEFLAELIGAPLAGDESAPLRAARQVAQVMSDQLERAWGDFLKAECAANPVLLVLEDLHWGDLPTVRFVDKGLRDLKHQPFMVLALARPEVNDIFPKLWAERSVLEVRHLELSRKASERLARQVLGESVSAETVQRIAAQAEGHAFYLEELIRAVAEGKGEALPETVLAMVQARLDGLDGDARGVLRAASIFGEVFWPGGVKRVLDDSLGAGRVDGRLARLVELEIIQPRSESRFPGEEEYAFRHALLGEGAYSMLTEEDCALGHRRAAEWMQERGENDPMVLAKHFDRGSDPDRAAYHFFRAAEQAIRGGDVDKATARATQGLACVDRGGRGAHDQTRIDLLGLLCEAHVWRNDPVSALLHADEVMRVAPPGSAPWARGMCARLIAAAQPELEAVDAMLETLCTTTPQPGALSVAALAMVGGIFYRQVVAQFEEARVALQKFRALAEPRAAEEPIVLAWFLMANAVQDAWANEDPYAALLQGEAAQSSFQENGHLQGGRLTQLYIGMAAWHLGALDRAERELRSVHDPYGFVYSQRAFYLACALADRGALDLAEREADALVDAGATRGLPLREGRGRAALAEVHRRRGALDAAEREALAACHLLASRPLDRAAVIATHAAVLLAQGRVPEALAAAEGAMASYESMGTFGYKGSFARVVHAEALEAAGERGPARAALAVARERLLANAAKIADLELRRGFLENIPEHARTLELARQWLDA